MAIRNSERDVAIELRRKAQQYRALARSIDDQRFADIAIKMSRACTARAQQIEYELASRAA